MSTSRPRRSPSDSGPGDLRRTTQSDASFRPAWWLPGGHLQTIVPSLWPAPAVSRRSESIVVPVEAGSSVRVEIDRPADGARGTLLLVHGMCGSAESGYMRRTARLGLKRGWVTARMNLRNCGGTEELAATLYNAGQSDDVGCVLAALRQARLPRPFVSAAFSLGGNILLRYAGIAGSGAAATAFAAVNPPIDLERTSRSIELPRNRVYQRHYTVRLCRQYRRVQRIRGLPGPRPTARLVGSVRGFDRRFTAPDAGFPSAEAYYAEASAAPRLSGVRKPALVLSARDDPFVPAEMFAPHHGAGSIRFLHPGRGGHCGYTRSRRPRFWAAEVLLDFFEERVRGPLQAIVRRPVRTGFHKR